LIRTASGRQRQRSGRSGAGGTDHQTAAGRDGLSKGIGVALSGDDRQDVAEILADRLAATLVHHEPGWRLPRPSALARRYNVRPAQVEQAVRELTARHLIRQLPDGQLYRASPAEYMIPVQGVPRLGAHLDPMGGQVACRKRKVSWRRAPEDIAWALGIAPADSVCAVRCHWSVNGEPAAISTTYLTGAAAAEVGDLADDRDRAIDLQLWGFPDGEGRALALGVPAALHVELQPPPSSVARGLRLGAGQPAAMLTVRFDDQPSARPVALTVAALRADLFRIVIDSPAESSPVSAVASAAALDDGLAQAGDDDPWPADDHPAVRQ
jgi:DNA-binding GntR family transcriptional regulator